MVWQGSMSIGMPLIISGPTASGKSGLAVKLAKYIGGVIINADTIQFYKHLDIGSAKPSLEERGGIEHLNYDLFDHNSCITAQEFYRLTEDTINSVLARGLTPILVGSSGLYLSTLLCGYTLDLPKASKEASEKFSALETGILYQRLLQVDPQRAQAVNANDRFRIIRALGIIESTGSKVSMSYQEMMRVKGIPSLVVIPVWEREALYERINRRVDLMFQAGLIEEVRKVAQIYPPSHIALKSIGYSQVIDYLEGRESLESVRNLIKQLSRNYAKRQLTFWKNLPLKNNWLTVPQEPFKLTGKIKELNGIKLELPALVDKITQKTAPPFSKSEIWYIEAPLIC